MREPRRRDNGFTLLEVIVALAILSGVLVLGYRVMTGAVAAEERSERWTQAALLGEALMRETTSTFPDVGETSGTFSAPNDPFSWKVTVKESLHADVREVDIVVTYRAAGLEESVSLAGIAAK